MKGCTKHGRRLSSERSLLGGFLRFPAVFCALHKFWAHFRIIREKVQKLTSPPKAPLTARPSGAVGDEWRKDFRFI